MSETDSFIEEVSEEVRRDKLFGYFKKYGWIAGLAIAALVGGTAYSEWSKAQSFEAAKNRGDAILATSVIEDADERAAAVRALADQEDATVVVKLLAAGDGSPEAIAFLNEIANDFDQPAYLRDLASFRVALTDAEIADDEKAAILQDLSQPGGLYRNAATEFLVTHYLATGQQAKAVELLQEYVVDAEASDTQRQRFLELMVALGVTPQLANQADPDSQG